MDWLFEASRDIGRRIPWISIPGVASIVHRRERGRGGGTLMGGLLNRCTARAATGPHGKGEKRPPRGGAGRALPVLAHGLGRPLPRGCAPFREPTRSNLLSSSVPGPASEASLCRDQWDRPSPSLVRSLSIPRPSRSRSFSMQSRFCSRFVVCSKIMNRRARGKMYVSVDDLLISEISPDVVHQLPLPTISGASRSESRR